VNGEVPAVHVDAVMLCSVVDGYHSSAGEIVYDV
jgi:hypothetical protein